MSTKFEAESTKGSQFIMKYNVDGETNFRSGYLRKYQKLDFAK